MSNCQCVECVPQVQEPDILEELSALIANENNIYIETYTRAIAEITSLRQQLAEWERLKDPHTLHVHLLRGFPAMLSDSQKKHLLGEQPNVDVLVEALTNIIKRNIEFYMDTEIDNLATKALATYQSKRSEL